MFICTVRKPVPSQKKNKETNNQLQHSLILKYSLILFDLFIDGMHGSVYEVFYNPMKS